MATTNVQLYFLSLVHVCNVMYIVPRVYNNRRGGECLTLDITRTDTLR